MNTGLSVPGRTARLLAGRLHPLIGAGSSGQRNASDEECSSISSVNGSSFDGRAEAVVVRGCDQAEVGALLTWPSPGAASFRDMNARGGGIGADPSRPARAPSSNPGPSPRCGVNQPVEWPCW